METIDRQDSEPLYALFYFTIQSGNRCLTYASVERLTIESRVWLVLLENGGES